MKKAVQPYIDEYLRAALDRDQERAEAVVARMIAGGSDLATVFEVLAAAQHRVGDLWEKGVASVSDEHFVTDTTLSCVSFASERLAKFRRTTRGLAILFTAEGEYHVVALKMLSELLRDQGWDTEFLGSNPSSKYVLERARAKGKVDLICVSATMPSSLPNLVETLQKIRAEPFFANAKIVAGGPVFRSKRASVLLRGGAGGGALADSVSEGQTPALKFTASLGRNEPVYRADMGQGHRLAERQLHRQSE
jgi:MerR family transcriptional regulator, light-induced transcriptional regulator